MPCPMGTLIQSLFGRKKEGNIMSTITIPYEESEKQALFHASEATETFYGGAKGGGKLLCLNTPIPTLTGWTTMGEISCNDVVFDENGEPCNVVSVSEIQHDKTYRLTFSDGSEIIAGAVHEWVTETARDRAMQSRRTDEYRERRRASRPSRGKGEKPWLARLNNQREYKYLDKPISTVKTTQEIVDTLYDAQKGKQANHAIPVCGSLNLPNRDLLIHPYVLGAWLGDGTTQSGEITGIDPEIFSEIESHGYKVIQRKSLVTYKIQGLISKLRSIGVLGNKRIPGEYLRASIEQRISLLQGLMDTDGYCDKRGQCEFTTTNKRLSEDVCELICSLGIKVAIKIGRAKLNGKDCGEKYRLKFITNIPAFSLPRKIERQKMEGFRGTHNRRYIIKAEEIERVPMRCITVDSPSHLYLCGRSMIPTHNSTGLVMDCFAYVLEFPGAEAYLFRETYDDLEANLISEWKARVPDKLYKYNESKHEARLKNGSIVRFRYVSNYQDAEHYQGRSIDYIGVDELTKHEEKTIQELLSCLRSAKGFPPTFKATGNPGGKGHRWVKKRYITPTDYGQKEYTDLLTGNRIAFIPSKVYDNPAIMANDPAYVRRLENLPEAKRRAFLHGDWDVYTGQAFPEWSEKIHVCDNFEPPEHWMRWRCLDNGYSDPFYWGWLTVSPEGIVYLYREFTREEDDPKILYTEQAEKAVELSKHTILENGRAITRQEKINYTVAGVDAWNKHHRDQTGKSLVDYYMDGGVGGLVKAITDRKLRKDTFHEYLKPLPVIEQETGEETGEYYAKFQVMKRCKKFIEYMPELVEDEDNADMVADCNYDHPFDSVGYGIISYHAKFSKNPVPEKPLIQRQKEKKLRKFHNQKRRRMA